jgi:hypothetical protein
MDIGDRIKGGGVIYPMDSRVGGIENVVRITGL